MLDEAPLLSNEMRRSPDGYRSRPSAHTTEAVKAMLPAGINHRIIRSFCAIPDVDKSAVDSLDADERQVYEYLLTRSGYVKPGKLSENARI